MTTIDHQTNWRLFLAKFIGKMNIQHRPGRTHANTDALSRVRTIDDEPQTFSMASPRLRTLKSNEHISILQIFCAPVVTRRAARNRLSEATQEEIQDSNIPSQTVQELAAQAIRATAAPSNRTLTAASTFLDNDFIKSIAGSLPNDRTFGKVYRKMLGTFTDSPTNARVTTFESFRLDHPTKLLFFRDSDTEERLCLPQNFLAIAFKIAHDDRSHVGTRRTYEFLRRHILIPRLQKQTSIWVSNCPICNAAKTSHQGLLGTLMPIKLPPRQMSTICTDFITSFPMSTQGNNTVATITDPLTKWVSVLIGKDTFSAKDWAEAYYRIAFVHWGLPEKIISDRDAKFTSEFWTELCSWAKVKLALTTAWHPQADGQSENTNKTLIHALRCTIGGRYDQSGWEDLILHVLYNMNTSISASTGMTPWELRYGRKPRSLLSVYESESQTTLSQKGARDYVHSHETLIDEAKSAVALAQARMKIIHDRGRTGINLNEGDLVNIKLAKGTDRGYHLLHNTTKLSFVKHGPYQIDKVIVPGLSFQVRLPDWLPIHPIISIEHLEPARRDPHNRLLPPTGPIHDENGVEKYIIDKVHNEEMRSVQNAQGRRLHYEVSHLGYLGTE